MLERYLNVKELAVLLGYDEGTIYHWVSTGYIPYVKLGGGIRFNQNQVLQWIQARTHNGRVTRIPKIKLTNLTN